MPFSIRAETSVCLTDGFFSIERHQIAWARITVQRAAPMTRITAIVLFWVLWAGMVAGAVLIIVLKNGDVPKTTTTTAAPTTTHK
ncbi:hypothetical protein COOONC_15754 [Cooperia oncophora]